MLHVCVNRDPETYSPEYESEDRELLNSLLSRWSNAGFDYYEQFISETYRALKPLMKEHRGTEAERRMGCLYGGAAGDALGYSVEFMSLDEIRGKYGPEGITYYDLTDGEARFSDDTQMTLFTLEGIYLWHLMRQREREAKLRNSLFAAYRDWLFTQERDGIPKQRHKAKTKLYHVPEMHRRMGPGFTCIRSLRSKKAGSIDNLINDSKGNGGVMRVSPIGMMLTRASWTIEDVIRMGAESAALTHGHPLGFISAGMMAGLVNECIYGEAETLKDAILYAKEKTDQLFSSFEVRKELFALVDKAMELAGKEIDDVEAIAMLGHSACAESTMAIAVYCALKYTDDFGRAIIAAVNFNGDSDSVAAVTGNILGAWCGCNDIDPKWIEPLHLDRYLSALSEYVGRD